MLKTMENIRNLPLENISCDTLSGFDNFALYILEEHEHAKRDQDYKFIWPATSEWTKTGHWINTAVVDLVNFRQDLQQGKYTIFDLFKRIENEMFTTHAPSKLVEILSFVYNYVGKHVEFKTRPEYTERFDLLRSYLNYIGTLANIDFEIESKPLKNFKAYLMYIAEMNTMEPRMCGSFFEACCGYVLNASFKIDSDIHNVLRRPELESFIGEVFMGRKVKSTYLLKILKSQSPTEFKDGLFGLLLLRALLHYVSRESCDVVEQFQICKRFLDYYSTSFNEHFRDFMKALEQDLTEIYIDGSEPGFVANVEFNNATTVVKRYPDTRLKRHKENYKNNKNTPDGVLNHALHKGLAKLPDNMFESFELKLKGVIDIMNKSEIIDCKVCKSNDSTAKRKWFYQLLLYLIHGMTFETPNKLIEHLNKQDTATLSIIDGYTAQVHIYNTFKYRGY